MTWGQRRPGQEAQHDFFVCGCYDKPEESQALALVSVWHGSAEETGLGNMPWEPGADSWPGPSHLLKPSHEAWKPLPQLTGRGLPELASSPMR